MQGIIGTQGFEILLVTSSSILLSPKTLISKWLISRQNDIHVPASICDSAQLRKVSMNGPYLTPLFSHFTDWLNTLRSVCLDCLQTQSVVWFTSLNVFLSFVHQLTGVLCLLPMWACCPVLHSLQWAPREVSRQTRKKKMADGRIILGKIQPSLIESFVSLHNISELFN